jgi:hypothetical protein
LYRAAAHLVYQPVPVHDSFLLRVRLISRKVGIGKTWHQREQVLRGFVVA